MSTPANHNDDLFRQPLEDYREMPSDKVWDGIAQALDQKKKKKRLFFWLLFSGAGSSLAAALLLIPVLTKNAARETAQTDRTALHLAEMAYVSVPASSSVPAVSVGSEPLVPTVTGPSAPIASTGPFATGRNGSSHKNGNAPHSHSLPIHTASSTSGNDITQNGSSTTESSSQVPEGHDKQMNITSQATATSTQTARRDVLTAISLSAYGAEKTANPYNLSLLPARSPDAVRRFKFKLAPFITVQGYGGGVAYQRTPTKPSTGTVPNGIANDPSVIDTVNHNKRFGQYASTSIKVGFFFTPHWYANVGIGYETYRFAGRYQFSIPGSLGSLNPSYGQFSEVNANTSFGDVFIPVVPQDALNTAPTPLNGKLVYQNHQLFVPLEVGYRWRHGPLGAYVSGSAAFHIPLAQSAVFYADSGPNRTVMLNKAAPFNLSLGMEPGIEYYFAKRFSLMAGGTFQYNVLNAFQNGNSAVRPYVLAAHLGLRIQLYPKK